MYFSGLSLLLATTAAASFANAFYITEPFTGGKNSFWKTGSSVKVAWDRKDGSTCKAILVDLMFGPSLNAKAVRSIANGLSNSASSASWTVPEDLPTSDKYFIRITCDKEDPSFHYSSRFTINGQSTNTDNLIPKDPVSGTANDGNTCAACAEKLNETSGGARPILAIFSIFLLSLTISIF